MTSIRNQAHGVLTFKLNHSRLGSSLSLSKAWQAQEYCYKSKRPSVRIYQEQRMNSIRTQAYGVLAFKLTHARLGISLYLSKAWQAQE